MLKGTSENDSSKSNLSINHLIQASGGSASRGGSIANGLFSASSPGSKFGEFSPLCGGDADYDELKLRCL